MINTILNRIIPYSFYLLFFLTPLVWSSSNHELFEYNKMILTYGLTVIIVGAWVLKTIHEKRLTIKRTPLDIPLLLFLGANILSTIFSIDPHTSIWGYYSRSNGGLLSIITYILLYFAFVSNMDFEKVKLTLKFGLASGFIISLWAIFEHFGVSLSCVILRGEFNASCWIQDVQARVFATLGQPNWLAAYLSMLIFPAFYFLLTATKKSLYILHFTLLIFLYLAFTFTYSRGPTLGLIGGMAAFLFIMSFPRKRESIQNYLHGSQIKSGMTVLISFLIINLLFGSALTSFRLISKFAAPARPGISLPAAPSGTQLENGGTESGQIRFIVWKGALDIFKHYPVFGSGVETFAYSYYQFRPAEHNLTSEWDFLYNKAHNEYLNYLSTTGLIGFGTYMLVIGTFIYWCMKKIYNLQFTIYNEKSKNNFTLYILHCTLLAAYISYLIYNFFLFSVVIIAIFFFLFPALAFVATGALKPFAWPQRLLSISNTIYRIIYRRPAYTQVAKGIVILVTMYFLYSVIQFWYADTIFAKGEKASDAGNPGRAYNLLSFASDINPGEPLYRSELGFAAAQAAAALQDSDASLSAELKDNTTLLTENVLNNSPKNVSFFRTAVRTYFELSVIDPAFINKTLQILDQSIKLAPTDPKLYYNKALILESIGKKEEQIEALQKAIQLKPNYLEALAILKEATKSGDSVNQ
ncbi:MAG: O-antigen ligase family protein [Candidatus Daviesbacteria bacterium]|nr:O-antigen ligase family protein [Candidatus Daviesbacteria bacterium]